MAAPDDDLDWLYGRNRPAAPEPEPTRVLPPVPPNRPPGNVGGPGQAPPSRQPPSYQPSSRQAAPPPSTSPTSPAAPGGSTALQPAVSPGPPAPPPLPPYGGRPAGRAARPPRRRRPFRTLFRLLTALVLVFLLALVGIPAYAWSQVQRVDESPSGARPANQPGTTFLLVGSDSREGLTAAERKKLGTGDTGGQRTDTILILYIPPGGKPALISIPRDSYVPIPGHGSNKINAAYAFDGPQLMVQTVEQNTGLRIDAYLEIGFGGFVNVIDSVGGIEMCLPQAIKDKNSHLDLPKGCQTLNGTDALGYVRMRYADPLGDLGRVQRQRAMLAAVAEKAVAPSSVLNSVRYWKLSHATADSLRLGERTTFRQMASLALAMRKVSGNGGLTLTVPIGNPEASTPSGSAVLWDEKKAKAMFADIARGDTSGLSKYAE